MKLIALFSALFALFSLGFITVRQHSIAFRLGYRIGDLHNEIKALRAHNRILRFKVEQRKNPARLLDKISAMRLNLHWRKNDEPPSALPLALHRRGEQPSEGSVLSQIRLHPIFQRREESGQDRSGIRVERL